MDKFKRSALAAECVEIMREELEKIGGVLLLDALIDDYFALKVENNALKVENAELRERVFRCVEDLPGEEWRDIEGYEGRYQVSNLGRVKSFRKGGVIILFNSDYVGYFGVTLHLNGHSNRVFIHRLVAEAFIPNPENKPQVNHKDGNKHNNCVENLEWCTQAENNRHAFALGLHFRKNRKLSFDDVRYIRENPDCLSYRQLAKKFNVESSVIYCVRHGKIYKDVK